MMVMKQLFSFFTFYFLLFNFSSAQNVGIGTNLPQEKLQVDSGSIKIGNTVWSALNTWFLKFGDGNYVTIGEDEADDRLLIRAKNLIIKPSSNYNGFVGINTPYAPTSPLEIYSPINTSSPGLRITQQGYGLPGSYDASWNIYCSDDGGVFSNYLYFRLFSTNKAFIAGADGSYYAVSDKRYKREIQYLDGQLLLPKIMQLKPATYFMKEDTLGLLPRLGFVSQDVETVFPQVVTSAGNVKMMNYSGLIPVLTKGMQEQQLQIERLQKENADIRQQLTAIKKQIGISK
jgi:hypothetical protein